MSDNANIKSRIVAAVRDEVGREASAAGHDKYERSSYSKGDEVFTKEGYDREGSFTRDSFTKSVD